MRTSDDVIDAAVRIAAEVISPSASGGRRAAYLTIDGDLATVVAQYDEAGRKVTGPVRLRDHPALAEVVTTRQPVLTTFEPAKLGATAADAVTHTRVTHGAAVPIVVDERLAGVLAVGGRNRPVTELARLIDLAGVVELALANATMYEQLAELAAVRERERMAARLNSVMSRTLFGASLELSAALQGGVDVEKRIRSALDSIDQAIAAVRASIYDPR